MIKSVVTKLWITIFALILGILLVFSLFLANRLETIYFSHQVKLMNEHARQWEKVLLSGLPEEKIQQEMEFWRGVSNYDVAVFDEQRIVRYSSDVTHSPIGKKSSWTHVRAGIEDKEAYYTGFNPETNSEMTATFLSFESNKGQKYLIMVHAPTHDLLEMIKATRSVGLLVLILFFTLSGALVWYFSTLIAKPLINIRKIAMEMAKGDFSTLIQNDRDDELGDLSKTMNIMSIRLKKTLDSLTRANLELNTLLEKWKEFVADVSHELRTPLFLMQGYSEALMDNVVKDEQTRNEYLAVINKETLRLQTLVNDLLAVEGGLPLRKQPTDLYDLAQDTIVPFEIRAQDRKITIEVSRNLKKPGSVNVDPDKLGEVLYNLVDNALRYTPLDGRISINGEYQGDNQFKLIISDNGSGIPAEHLTHLFDRFYRVDKSRSRVEGGTGLGLAIAKKIVNQHGGKITVESEPGAGTVFSIFLPIQN